MTIIKDFLQHHMLDCPDKHIYMELSCGQWWSVLFLLIWWNISIFDWLMLFKLCWLYLTKYWLLVQLLPPLSGLRTRKVCCWWLVPGQRLFVTATAADLMLPSRGGLLRRICKVKISILSFGARVHTTNKFLATHYKV